MFKKFICSVVLIGLFAVPKGFANSGNTPGYYHSLKHHYERQEDYYDDLKDEAKSKGNYGDYLKYKKLKHKYEALKDEAKRKEKLAEREY